MSEKVKILVKRLSEKAVLPSRSHESDAGADVVAVSFSTPIEFRDGYFTIEQSVHCYGTGLAFEIPEGYWIDLRPRSSVYKTGMILCNSIGTIDASYRGEVKAMFYAFDGAQPYKVGDRVAQLVVMPNVSPLDVEFVEVEELSSTDRGTGGFGSTGK